MAVKKRAPRADQELKAALEIFPILDRVAGNHRWDTAVASGGSAGVIRVLSILAQRFGVAGEVR